MPRQARIVIPNTAHHITQRGNYRQNIFDKRYNYEQYCDWINEYASDNNPDILAYCLMKNHVHFVAIPKDSQSLALVFKTAHMRYSHYINRQRSVKGHLWQGRFYSCILAETHLYRSIRYVENNPVRTKLVDKAWEYNFSSAKDHTEGRDKPLIRLKPHSGINCGAQWKEYLQEKDIEMTKDIRIKTSKGLVVGTDRFIKQLEGTLKRSLKCVAQGRPKATK
jgi:putative transposase